MLDALQTLSDNGLGVEGQNAILENIFENGNFEDDDDKRAAVALLWYREQGNKCEPSDCKHHGGIVRICGAEYLVLTDDEADSTHEEYLEQMLDDVGLTMIRLTYSSPTHRTREATIAGADSPYFDREAWKRDAKIDGRGPSLACYDGDENEFFAKDGEWYYLYRIN